MENRKFRKSIFVSKDIKKGERITTDNIKVVRPGYGLEPKFYERVLGQVAVCDMEYGTPLQLEYIRKDI